MLHLGGFLPQLFLIQLPSRLWISKHMPSTACHASNDFYFAGVSKTDTGQDQKRSAGFF